MAVEREHDRDGDEPSSSFRTYRQAKGINSPDVLLRETAWVKIQRLHLESPLTPQEYSGQVFSDAPRFPH